MKKTKKRTQKARLSFSSTFFEKIFIAKSLRVFLTNNFCSTFALKFADFRFPAWTCQHVFSFLENLSSERERVAIFCCGTQRLGVSVQKESSSYICLQAPTSAHKTWQLNPPHVLCSRKSAFFCSRCYGKWICKFMIKIYSLEEKGQRERNDGTLVPQRRSNFSQRQSKDIILSNLLS